MIARRIGAILWMIAGLWGCIDGAMTHNWTEILAAGAVILCAQLVSDGAKGDAP